MSSLLRCIAEHSKLSAGRPAHTYLDSHGNIIRNVTYGELWGSAIQVATWLSIHSVPMARIGLIFETGAEFIVSFVGCLLSGRIAVPLNPPSPSRAQRTARICHSAGVSVILTSSAQLHNYRHLSESDTSLKLHWCTYEDVTSLRAGTEPSVGGRDDSEVALLQYTSGSTGDPKGVVITHKNILSNIRAKCATLELSADTVLLSWLPHHHDAGLIWGNLLPLVLGCRTYLMKPKTFAADPMAWIEALSKYRATMTAAPDFAYSWCVKTFDAQRLRQCDLSELQVALNAADIVRPATMKAFTDTFETLGLPRTAMHTAYGLAEATLYVSSSCWSRQVMPASDFLRRASVASSGHPPEQYSMLIVDPSSGKVVESGSVGEVWLQGESIAAGYWSDESETRRIFFAETIDRPGEYFLRTGDLGVLDPKEGLYICGRLKNVIIRHGRKISPEDIEATVADVDARLSPFGLVVLQDTQGESHEIVAVVELNIEPSQHQSMVDAIRRSVSMAHGIRLDGVVIVEPGYIRKTTSGKVQRSETLQRLKRDLPALRTANLT